MMIMKMKNMMRRGGRERARAKNFKAKIKMTKKIIPQIENLQVKTSVRTATIILRLKERKKVRKYPKN